ncbi:MAG TPA: cysteine hydrolase [Gammaproteobacteria bacterium]|nr:cysteine hydrolase [Gammaproteobacteria bacterium]
MTSRLLIIDPQNDFCDIPGAALPVPGADADMRRLAAFMADARYQLSDLIVTLDSHASIGIERTTFWLDQDLEEAAAFSLITEADVREGKYRPRDAELIPTVLAYLHELERQGRYRLMVWPVHCVVGTWGHNLHAKIAEEVAAWESAWMRSAYRALKGMNPMTEQYSAIRAEVPDIEDPSTQTNRMLIGRVRPVLEGWLFVAGEAASHCVAATVEHLLAALTQQECSRVVALRDCMSPVAGFEGQASACFERIEQAGGRVVRAGEARSLLV